MPDVRSAVEVIRDELVVAFETISTANTLEGVAFRTTIHSVNTVLSSIDKMHEFPQLDILFGRERMSSKDGRKDVWTSEVELALIGYFKVDAPSESEYPMTVYGEEFLHDVKRVLVDLTIKNVSTSNRWWFEKRSGDTFFEIERWAETDRAGNLLGEFGIRATITSKHKDVNLRPEVPA